MSAGLLNGCHWLDGSVTGIGRLILLAGGVEMVRASFHVLTLVAVCFFRCKSPTLCGHFIISEPSVNSREKSKNKQMRLPDSELATIASKPFNNLKHLQAFMLLD